MAVGSAVRNSVLAEVSAGERFEVGVNDQINSAADRPTDRPSVAKSQRCGQFACIALQFGKQQIFPSALMNFDIGSEMRMVEGKSFSIFLAELINANAKYISKLNYFYSHAMIVPPEQG